MNAYQYRTDAESGTIEAADFDTACVMLESMISDAAMSDGAWGWVSDIDGYRYTVGEAH